MSKLYYILPCIILNAFYCGGFPVLSELVNNRVNVIIKGTYESNSSYPWDTGNVYNNDYVSTLPSPLNNNIAHSDVRLYLDVADLQLSNESKARYSEYSDNNWSNFVRDRELLCPTTTTYQNEELTLCKQNDGVNRHIAFFDEGISLESNDVRPDTYKALSFFIRRFVSHPSFLYDASNMIINSDNSDGEVSTFDNELVKGGAVNTYYQYAPADDLSTTDNRFFPLFNNNLDLDVDDSTNEYVLEYRIFIKNLLMKHVIEDDSDTENPFRLVIVGLSDWNNNHDYSNDNRVNDSDIYRINAKLGGNLITGVRVYTNTDTGHIRFTAIPSCGVGKAYVVATPTGTSITTTTLPYTATQLTANITLNNLPSNMYDIYITQDKMLRNSTGLVSGEDGYPESNMMCMSNVNITQGNTLDLDISSCACP